MATAKAVKAPIEIKRSKRYVESFKNFTPDLLTVEQAVEKLKTFKPTKFDMSVELIFPQSSLGRW